MATVVEGAGTLNFSQACANQADEIILLDGTNAVIASTISFTWGTASSSTGIDLASSIEFTIGTGDTVAKVGLVQGGFIMATATFTSTYNFPNGGIFELTSLQVLVS